MKNRKGLSIIDIIISIAILAIIMSGIVALSLSDLISASSNINRVQANALAQEGLEAARAIKDFDWNALTPGAHGITDTNGYFEFSGVEDMRGKYTRSVEVADVNAGRKDITVEVSWD